MKLRLFLPLCLGIAIAGHASAQEPAPVDTKLPTANIDGQGPGWVSLGKDDFVNVNCGESTWAFPDVEIHCTGILVGSSGQSKEQATIQGQIISISG